MRIIAFFSVLAVSTAEALAAPSAPRNLRVCASDLASCGSDPDPEPPPPPPATGFPDASSTGPVAGTVFQDYEGVYEVRTDGAVLNGLRVRGAIVVNANNVTIQNCEVDGSGMIWAILGDAVTGLVVKNCRVYARPSRTDRDSTHLLVGVEGADEIANTELFGLDNAVSCGSCYMHDNYIHDFARWIAADDHTDGLQTYGHAGAGGLRVVHNTVIAILTGGDYTPTNYGAGSSALALSEGMHDLLVEDNLFAGGTYTLYGPSQAGSAPANVRIRNNRFSSAYYDNCGIFGSHHGFNTGAPGFQWTGNVWHETGAPLGP
ncbi:MAG: hypothetical protein ACAI38_12690 [Myxococcota bacterium]